MTIEVNVDKLGNDVFEKKNIRSCFLRSVHDTLGISKILLTAKCRFFSNGNGKCFRNIEYEE